MSMLALIILSIVFVVTPVMVLIATQEVRPREHRPSDRQSPNPEILRRPPRSRYPL
jgi:hypothetical protein